MRERAEEVRCQRCGEIMEDGYATAMGLIAANPPAGEAKLVFVVPGQSTSPNPIKALQQGLRDERENAAYLLRGYRCPRCGTVELLAREKIPWTP
jgi:DNA-directed RNA polymerase subunit RPC12/RpoP